MMLLSEFLNVMHNYSEKGMEKADFFLFLFDVWSNDSDASSNPFQKLNCDTIERYFSKDKISKKNARLALGNADKDNFAKYINALSPTNQFAIEEAIKHSIPDFPHDGDRRKFCVTTE